LLATLVVEPVAAAVGAVIAGMGSTDTGSTGCTNEAEGAGTASAGVVASVGPRSAFAATPGAIAAPAALISTALASSVEIELDVAADAGGAKAAEVPSKTPPQPASHRQIDAINMDDRAG